MAKATKLPSGSWRIRVGAGQAGKTVSFTAPTKKEVEIMAAEYLTGQRHPERRTIRQCADEYIESRRNMRSPSTIAGYDKIIRCNMDGLNDVRLCDLTQNKLQKCLDNLSANHAPKTAVNAFGFVRSVIIYATGRFDFAASLPKIQKDIIELPQPQAVIAAVKGTEIEIPCLLAIWLGLRMSEIRAIRKQDINDGVLTVSAAVITVKGIDIRKEETKTYRARKLRVPNYILGLISALPAEQEYITTFSGQAIYKRFVRLMDGANMKLTFHQLRHLNASVMAQLRVPEKYAMERGGWSTPKIMRDVYQHTFSAEAEAVADSMDAYFESIVR